MKELIQFFAYGVGGVAAIFILIEVMSSGISSGMAIAVGIGVVVILPLIIAMVVAKREKKGSAQ